MHHPQVVVTVGARTALVDAGLAPLIEQLWRAGIDTRQSCEAHSATGKVWISFPTATDAELFLNAVVSTDQTGWARAETWSFGQYESAAQPLPGSTAYEQGDHPAGWEFHAWVEDGALGTGDAAEFWIGIAVLFPRHDLDQVLERVRLWNEHDAEGDRDGDD